MLRVMFRSHGSVGTVYQNLGTPHTKTNQELRHNAQVMRRHSHASVELGFCAQARCCSCMCKRMHIVELGGIAPLELLLHVNTPLHTFERHLIAAQPRCPQDDD
jgi:hypothetical protein